MKRIQNLLFLVIAALSPATITSQVVVGTDTPDASAAFEIQGTDRGFLLPRLTTDQRNAIASPAFGLMILNTSTFCLEINVGTPAIQEWSRLKCRIGVISSIDCNGALINGNVGAGLPVSGASFSVPYSGGNGGVYDEQSIGSTGVTGLTATLAAGNFAADTGTLTYILSGIPDSVGLAVFEFNIGGQSCNLNINVGLSDEGLTGYWLFNGDAIDSSGNGFNGTVNGATLTTDRFGNSNSAYNFSGPSQYISTPHPGITGVNDRTISLWFKQTSSNNGIDQWPLFSYGDGNWGGGFSVKWSGLPGQF
jgi:hypothetical protein